MKRIELIKTAALLGVLLCFGVFVSAQTVVKGFVKDAATMKPIQFVSIYFEGGKGVTTGEDGSYSIVTNRDNLKILNFSFTGYKNIAKKIIVGKEQTVNIELELNQALQEVFVRTNKRGK